MAVGSDLFRKSLGCYATGVTVITALDPDGSRPVGVTVSAFSSLSLDPPLVLCCLGRTASSLAAIEASGHFAVNILSEHQREVSSRFAGPVETRWHGQAWRPTASGAPALPGCLATLDCRLDHTLPGGDHLIVVGLVEDVILAEDGRPLLHHRGRYLDLPPPL